MLVLSRMLDADTAGRRHTSQMQPGPHGAPTAPPVRPPGFYGPPNHGRVSPLRPAQGSGERSVRLRIVAATTPCPRPPSGTSDGAGTSDAAHRAGLEALQIHGKAVMRQRVVRSPYRAYHNARSSAASPPASSPGANLGHPLPDGVSGTHMVDLCPLRAQLSVPREHPLCTPRRGPTRRHRCDCQPAAHALPRLRF